MKLINHTILITGGGGGIGLAFAKALTKSSNTVIILGRDAVKLENAKRKGYAKDYLKYDLSGHKEKINLVKYFNSNYSKLNILINNAGIQHNYRFDQGESHLDLIEEEVSTNLIGPIKITDQLLPILLRQKNSLIINITSALAVVPKESAPVYCATKSALRSFSIALRYQLENTSVRVVEIVPALVDTAMTQGRGKKKISPEQLVEESIRGIRAGQEEIRIGATKLLFFINRVLPGLAKRIIRRG